MISLRNLHPPLHNHLLQLTLRPGFSSYAVLPHNFVHSVRTRLSLSPHDLGVLTQFHRMEMDPHSSDTEVMKPTLLGLAS